MFTYATPRARQNGDCLPPTQWRLSHLSCPPSVQNIEPVAGKLPAKREKAARSVKATAPVKPAKGSSKKDEIIALLFFPAWATLPQLMAATGWQKHSVRGFLSGTLNKKMGLKLSSSKNEAGERLNRMSE